MKQILTMNMISGECFVRLIVSDFCIFLVFRFNLFGYFLFVLFIVSSYCYQQTGKKYIVKTRPNPASLSHGADERSSRLNDPDFQRVGQAKSVFCHFQTKHLFI